MVSIPVASRVSKTLIVALALILMAVQPASALTPKVVLAEPSSQVRGSSNGTWLSWGSNSVAHPMRFNVYAQKIGSARRVPINAARTHGVAGNVIQGTNDVIYTQLTSSSWHLYLFNLDTKTRRKVRGVNTKWFEYEGRASTDFVLFDRDHRVNGVWRTDLLLYDRSAHTTRTLGTWKATAVVVLPSSVGAATASYTVIGQRTGANVAYVYNIAMAKRTRISVPSGKFAYAPAVDETDGNVYFARSGNGCGLNVSLRRVALANLAGPQTALATMPSGIDAFDLSIAPNLATGHPDLLFTRYRCSRQNGDIYALRKIDIA